MVHLSSDRSLVLSYIEGYSARDIAPFVESLRATGYAGDVVFFTFKVDADLERLFAEHRVQQIPVRRVDMKQSFRIPKELANSLGIASIFRPDGAINIRLAKLFGALNIETTALARRIAQLLWHCNSGRFFYYEQFLERHREYEHVLIADVRDVMFQRSPFDSTIEEALYLFEEFPATPLGAQIDNATWIKRLYGRDVLAKLANFPIVCAGVMMGLNARVLECVKVIAGASVTNYIGWGTDQGTLNHLVRTGGLSSVVVKPYGSGPAMHVGIAPRDTIRTDPQGRVLNAEGEVCNIIHQYDRHPDLVDTLRERGTQPPVRNPV